MTSIDPFANRSKALDAAASLKHEAAAVYAIVYLGDQLARLTELAVSVASAPQQTGNDGAPLGEVVHDEAAELVPSTVVDAVLTAVDLDALPHGAVVQDSDSKLWERTRLGWFMLHGTYPGERTLSSKTLFECRGPITATN